MRCEGRKEDRDPRDGCGVEGSAGREVRTKSVVDVWCGWCLISKKERKYCTLEIQDQVII